MERFFDIFFSSLALLVLSPLLVSIIIILKFSGEGEVFFFQERVGKDGKLFKLFKFATMLKNSENLGTGTITTKDDVRILPVGKFLRKTKINEFPQLLNIFFGDMSVIGPRPLTPQTFEFYPATSQNIVKKVRPGLSGIGSIIFRREEEIMQGAYASVDFYAKVIAPYKGELEEWFVNHQSLYIYFVSIIVTVWAVFLPMTNIVWRVYRGLPLPPDQLKDALNFKV